MREEHPCSCKSILLLLPFVLPNGPRRTEHDACLGESRREVCLWLFFSMSRSNNKFSSSNQQKNAQCIVLLIISCSGIFGKLFSWSKIKFIPIIAVMLKCYSIKKSPNFQRCLVPAAFNYFNVGWQMFSASPKMDPKW